MNCAGATGRRAVGGEFSAPPGLGGRVWSEGIEATSRVEMHRGCRKGRRWRVWRALDSDHEWLISRLEALADEAAHGWEGAARTVAETSGALLLLRVVLGVLLRDRWRRFTASPRLFVAVLPVQHGWRCGSWRVPGECELEHLVRWDLGTRRWWCRWARWWADGTFIRQEGYVRQLVSEA